MRISDWSSDVCSSDLHKLQARKVTRRNITMFMQSKIRPKSRLPSIAAAAVIGSFLAAGSAWAQMDSLSIMAPASPGGGWDGTARAMQQALHKENIVKTVEVTKRSDEHTSELQS